MAIKPGCSSQPDERLGFEGGLGNSPFEAEWYAIEIGFMIEKIKEDYFCFYKKKRYKYED
jgi:hypothetical protein